MATRKEMKFFTVESANKALPLVRVIVSDIANLSKDLLERRQHLEHLTAGREFDADDPYGEELAQTQKELAKDTERLEGYLQELRQLGVELKDGPEGIADFPALLDGELVYLCWKLGEPEVLHWHGVDDGFAGRQPLTAATVSDTPDSFD